MTTQAPYIHPATPPKLIKAFKRARYKYHPLAQARGVNVYWVHQAIRYGKRPPNDNIAKMLFFPKHPRKRFADCTHCGKQVEIKANGEMWDHLHPDGTICRGSDTRDFLPKFKPVRQPPTPSQKWWRYTLDKWARDTIVERLYNHAQEINNTPK